MIWLHVSELAIDKLLAGEVSGNDAVAMREHAAGCARCGERLDAALATQREKLPVLPIPRRRSHAPWLAVVAAAAAFVVFMLRPHSESSGARVKGTAVLGFYVQHGSDVRLGTKSDRVDGGDHIELFTTTTVPAWFAAIGVDSTGKRTIYVPPHLVDAGRERILPFSIEVDEHAETFTGIFCPGPFDIDAVPASCTSDSFALEKQ